MNKIAKTIVTMACIFSTHGVAAAQDDPPFTAWREVASRRSWPNVRRRVPLSYAVRKVSWKWRSRWTVMG